MGGGELLAGEGGGGGIDFVYVVPYGGGANGAKRGDDEWEEGAVAVGGAFGVFGDFLGGSGGYDGVGVGGGGGEVRREEGTGDCEINGDGVLG